MKYIGFFCMNNSKMNRLIFAGLKKNYHKSIQEHDKNLMEFTAAGFMSIRGVGSENFRRKVENGLRMAYFFLENYRWGQKK